MQHGKAKESHSLLPRTTQVSQVGDGLKIVNTAASSHLAKPQAQPARVRVIGHLQTNTSSKRQSKQLGSSCQAENPKAQEVVYVYAGNATGPTIPDMQSNAYGDKVASQRMLNTQSLIFNKLWDKF